MNTLVAAGAGFLFAVLWFDLMFDVQALRVRGGELPEAVLSSIAGYYRRVTTTARPMDRLIALVMLVTLAAIIIEIMRGDVSAWVGWTSLVLAAAPITLAATRALPRAVRLGAREDPVDRQSALARSVGRDHLLCLASMRLCWCSRSLRPEHRCPVNAPLTVARRRVTRQHRVDRAALHESPSGLAFVWGKFAMNPAG